MRRHWMPAGLALTLCGTLAAQRPPDDPVAVAAVLELARVREQLATVAHNLRERTDELESTQREVRGMARELDGVKERLVQLLGATLPAGSFLAAPPSSSDMAGVAKVAVLAPHMDIDSPNRHDIVFVKLARIETGGVRALAEREINSSDFSLELPIDQSGALYVASWTTAEGYNFPIVLRDGATGQVAATVQVRQLQREGRFVFVGYRVD